MQTDDILLEVGFERDRQKAKGWTPEHDAEHGVLHLLQHAQYRMPQSEWLAGELAYSYPTGDKGRKQLIEAAALIVAALEVWDVA